MKVRNPSHLLNFVYTRLEHFFPHTKTENYRNVIRLINNANLEQLIYATVLKNYESEVESHASSPNDEFYSWTSTKYTQIDRSDVGGNQTIFRNDDARAFFFCQKGKRRNVGRMS